MNNKCTGIILLIIGGSLGLIGFFNGRFFATLLLLVIYYFSTGFVVTSAGLTDNLARWLFDLLDIHF